MRPVFLQFWCAIKAAYKNGFQYTCVPCMFEHVGYEPFSL